MGSSTVVPGPGPGLPPATDTRPLGTIGEAGNHSSSQSSADKSNNSLNPGHGVLGPGTTDNSSASGEDVEEFSDLPGTTASEWSPEEIVKLEEALAKYPADALSPLERYVQVAAALPNKTARDVAFRVKSLQQEDKRRRLLEEVRRKQGLPPRPVLMVGNSRPGSTAPQGVMAAVAAGAASTSYPTAGDDLHNNGAGVPVAVTQLMEQNYNILNQFKANMAHFKVVENTELLVKYRDNLVSVQQHMGSMTGVMGQMPPLPVQPNLELASKFLPMKNGGMGMMGMMPPFPFNPAAGMPGGMPHSGGMSMPLLPPLQMENFFGPGMPGGMPGVMPMPNMMAGMPGLGLAGMPGMPPMMPGMSGMQLPPGMLPAGMQGMMPPGMLPSMPMPGMSIPGMHMPDHMGLQTMPSMQAMNAMNGNPMSRQGSAALPNVKQEA